jgi:hypothetical protein
MSIALPVRTFCMDTLPYFPLGRIRQNRGMSSPQYRVVGRRGGYASSAERSKITDPAAWFIDHRVPA